MENYFISYEDLVKGVNLQTDKPKKMFSPTHHLRYNRGTIFDWSVKE